MASGTDVPMQIAPRPGEEAGMLMVQVWAVMAGSLARVTAWDLADADSWPEVICDSIVFASDAPREVQDHGAGVGVREEADVLVAAGSEPTAFPLFAQVSPAR